MSGNRLAQLLARALMGLGLALGTLAMCIWLFDIRIDIPAWMWRVAIAKLTLASGVGMLITGAALLRHLRRSTSTAGARGEMTPPDELPAPNWSRAGRAREQDPVMRTRTPPPTP